jgi:tetratricopeptide (TPR) repeat protein
MIGEVPADSGADRERRLDAILAAYLEANVAGTAPDRQALIDQHPDLAEVLRAFFDDYDRVHRLARPLHAVAQAARGEAATTPAVSDVEPGPVGPQGTVAMERPGPHVTTDFATDAPLEPDGSGQDADLPGGSRVRYFGDYELKQVLGRGGMGVVYKAKQLSLNRLVALKMIRSGVLADGAELRRFQNEAEAVAALDHSGIVPIHEVGEHDGQRYFSMKLVPGDSLAAKLDQYHDDPRGAAGLLFQVAEAVHHAHQRGILHRDLKPANILIDEHGHTHVTDFGLAKKVEGDGELTQSGAILGTPPYMAPEQTTGRRGAVTTATDVYGLGAVLYALLAGKAPFGGESAVETLEAVRHRAPEPPSRVNPTVPRDLEVICLKCLEKDPQWRYRSADALADDLRRWLAGEPITARPVGPAVRTWMWCRRHPLPAALTAALMLAVLVGSVASTALWLRAERNLRREQAARQLAQRRFDLAVGAIRTFHAGVSEDTLLKEPKMRSLRDQLLGAALEFYRQLEETLRDDPDPKAQTALGRALYEVGAIAGQVGKASEATIARQRALEIRERLAASHPDNDEFQRDLAASFMAGLPVEGGEAKYVRALAIRERLAVAHPGQVRYQADLAESLATHRPLPKSLPDTRGHLEQLRRNAIRLEKVVAAYPSSAEIRHSLIDLFGEIAAFLNDFGDLTGRLQYNRLALDHVRRLPEPRSESDLTKETMLLGGLVYALSLLGRSSEALAPAREVVALSEQLAASKPAVTSYRNGLARSISVLGELQLGAGDLVEAESNLRRSRQMLDPLTAESPDLNALGLVEIALGKVEARRGRGAEALKTLRDALTRWGGYVLDASAAGRNESRISYCIVQMQDVCTAIVDLPDSAGPPESRLEPLLELRDRFGREGRAGRLRPVTRIAIPALDIHIARLQYRVGSMDAARETARRAESELGFVAYSGDAHTDRYNEACLYARLSTVLHRPGADPPPADAAEIRRIRDEAMRRLRQAVTAGQTDSGFISSDADLVPLHSRPDFRELMMDLAFPDDPFAR